MSEDQNATLTAELTAEIVSAYVSNNPVAADQLSTLIKNVGQDLANLKSSGAEPQTEPREPAVPIKKSITKYKIICLECGLSFKSLKRHLGSAHGLTPDEYRRKWGLPADYPMITPQYAKARSELAVEMGLGRKRSGS